MYGIELFTNYHISRLLLRSGLVTKNLFMLSSPSATGSRHIKSLALLAHLRVRLASSFLDWTPRQERLQPQ
jgi:hypothetical protein